MNQQTQRTATMLTYCGILPFLFLSIAVILKFTGQDYGFALRAYGAVIISFLCGLYWAAQLFSPHPCRRNLLLTSNIMTLVAYAALLLAPHTLAFLIESVCFIFLLLLDYELLKQHIISLWYFNLRRNATGVVVFLLLAAASLS